MAKHDELLDRIVKGITALGMGETTTFELTDDRVLYVENWRDPQGEAFTSFELNAGEEVLECATCDFGNEPEIAVCAEYLLLCCE